MQLNFVIQLTIKIRNYGSNNNYLKVIKMEEIIINVAWLIIFLVLGFLFFFNNEEENPNE